MPQLTKTEDERRALVDQLAAQLRARVLSGDLPAGTRLRQEALAAEFGVSRTPIREALRTLHAGGLVELHPNRGAHVRGLSPREIRDAYEVRATLEALAAGLAAERISHSQLEALGEANRQFCASLQRTVELRNRHGGDIGDAEASRWGRANDQFHQVIQEAAGNNVLVEMLTQLHRNFPRDLSRIVVSESTTLLEEGARQHQSILEAIGARDRQAAHDLMLGHVSHVGQLVTLRFEQRLATAPPLGR